MLAATYYEECVKQGVVLAAVILQYNNTCFLSLQLGET